MQTLYHLCNECYRPLTKGQKKYCSPGCVTTHRWNNPHAHGTFSTRMNGRTRRTIQSIATCIKQNPMSWGLLSPTHKEVLSLRSCGKTLEEIAAIQGVSKQNIYQMQRRALKALQSHA